MGENRNRFGLKRYIPAAVLRSVRRRCHFGCVVCGAAIYEYHHFDPPFEDATTHGADGITLLCGSCHTQVTRGRWSEHKVAEANRRPYCASHPPHDLLDLAPPLHLLLGSILLTGEGDLVVVNGDTLIRVQREEGHVLLSATLTVAGRPVVKVVDNVLVICDPGWDVTAVGRKIRVQSDRGECALELVVYPPHGLHLRVLKLHDDGVHMESDDSGQVAISTGGKPTVQLKDYVMHAHGSLQLDGAGLRATGGIALVPYSSQRLRQLSERGDLRQLVTELYDNLVHVKQDSQSGQWVVQVERATYSFPTRVAARNYALGLCLLAPRSRAILHLPDRKLEFFPNRG